MSGIPHPEHPSPTCRRDDWLCLNGDWEFESDRGDSGLERGLLKRPLAGRITVPFCPESDLSGVGDRDFHHAVWYRRRVVIPSSWAGRHAVLRFQAVDHEATVWVGEREVGRHRGGSTPFICRLAGTAGPGDEIVITVRARDPARGVQARGKQSQRYAPSGCHYPRVTGIWQTVWLEAVPEAHLGRPWFIPRLEDRLFHLVQPLQGARRASRVRARLTDGKGVVSEAETAASGLEARLTLAIPPERLQVWEVGCGRLYGTEVELVDAAGVVVDRIHGHAGLRSVAVDGDRFLINGRPVFQRLVLDQGWWPDGLLTAPDDAARERDIRLALDAGFNGARLHQKIFEERHLYHADRLGFICWGEFPDWGCTVHGLPPAPDTAFVSEWLDAIARDRGHPCLVGWCGINEEAVPISDRMDVLDVAERAMFLAAKLADGSRPVLDASGWCHRVAESDIYDAHDYDQDPASFRRRYAPGARPPQSPHMATLGPTDLPPHGQPYFVSEFGGIWWNPQARPDEASWGYGNRPASLEEFHARFAGLCRALLDSDHFGYCYTQLTDVFQEQNGIYAFDRSAKFDPARLRAAQAGPAGCEKADGQAPGATHLVNGVAARE